MISFRACTRAGKETQHIITQVGQEMRLGLTIASLFQIRVVENEERTVSSELKGQLLQTVCTMLGNELPNSSLYIYACQSRI